MPSVACAGSVIGSSTRQKTLKRDALSSSAASSISRGMPRKYWVIRNTPNGMDRPGRISPA